MLGMAAAGTMARQKTLTEPPADEFFSSVVALFLFQGTEGSTTFTDSSNSATDGTRDGTTHDITQSVADPFGNTDGVLDISQGNSSNASRVVIPTRTGMDFTGDYTMEYWWKSAAANQNDMIWSAGTTLYHYNQFMRVYNSSYACNSFSNDTNWHHTAFVRSGTSMEFYFDGTRTATATNAGTHTTPSIYWGYYVSGNNLPWTGYISNFRYTDGVARYTGATITVPTEAFPTA